MCKDILENGVSTEGEKVRPHWEDGTPAYTIKKFGVVNRYDLSKEFPLVTLRKTALKSATDELLWIWQKKSNNVHDLKSRIWDSWADENGSIGKAYGYQLAKKSIYKEGILLPENFLFRKKEFFCLYKAGYMAQHQSFLIQLTMRLILFPYEEMRL